ncbi:hypothetical protein [Solidesulfovibrio alcoholivorans]|uniref:hypothetical protein n=1 Tax=Solidesulfovibrio alcoholivorans TaxID=81406 RepID=UPI000496A90A|nr:hypothetical protein [Solidesulfovibrio alcoholivorans]
MLIVKRFPLCAGVALFVLTLAFGLAAAPAHAGDAPLLLAQQGPMGMQPGQQQGNRQQQNMPQGGQGGNTNNSCMQSYQRCVMMCAGVANCINNCNVGYAVCTNPQGARPRGQ